MLYDLVALARGKGAEAITGLELADVKLDLRLPEDRALVDRLSAIVRGGGDMPVPRLVVKGRNVAATVSVEGQGRCGFVAKELGISTVEAEPTVSLDGRFSYEVAGAGLVSGPLSLSGSISRDFGKARLALALAASSSDFSLAMQRFELVYGNGELSLTKVKDRAPLDASIRINLEGGESSVSLRMDGYALSRSLRVSGRLAEFGPWLDIPYTGSLALRTPNSDLSKLSYDASLSGSLPAELFHGGRGRVLASLSVNGDAESATVRTAKIARGSEFLEYKGSLRFRDLAPDGVLDLRLELGTRDSRWPRRCAWSAIVAHMPSWPIKRRSVPPPSGTLP